MNVNKVILNQTFWQILTRDFVWRNIVTRSILQTTAYFHQFKNIYNFQADKFRKGRCKSVREAHLWGHKATDTGTFLNVPKRDGQTRRRNFTSDTVSYCRKTSNPLPPHSLMLRWIWNWVKLKIFGWYLSRTRKLSRDQFERIRTVHFSIAFVGRIISHTILYSVAKCKLHLGLLI
jgi:hypothetical protein